jgi:hypothetical protein
MDGRVKPGHDVGWGDAGAGQTGPLPSPLQNTRIGGYLLSWQPDWPFIGSARI